MNEKSPRERLLESANALLYEKGYDTVSVNEIIEASNTHKASFYRYFASKDELGILYLRSQGAQIQEGWVGLMQKTPSPEKFIELWVSLLKRQVRSGKFFGCPLARFMSSESKPTQSTNIAKEILESWKQTLEEYFETYKKTNILPSQFPSKEKAEKLLKIYQANSQFYVMTRDSKYFDEMKEEMLLELR